MPTYNNLTSLRNVRRRCRQNLWIIQANLTRCKPFGEHEKSVMAEDSEKRDSPPEYNPPPLCIHSGPNPEKSCSFWIQKSFYTPRSSFVWLMSTRDMRGNPSGMKEGKREVFGIETFSSSFSSLQTASKADSLRKRVFHCPLQFSNGGFRLWSLDFPFPPQSWSW